MTAAPEIPGTQDIKVRVTGLNKAFDGDPVLQDIDLAIPAGKNSVLIGPAASGKSVLMKWAPEAKAASTFV